jgi:alkylated DNA repair dioxygenase AlkB
MQIKNDFINLMRRKESRLYEINDVVEEYHLPLNLFMENETFNELWNLRPNEVNLIKMFNKEIPAPRRYKVYGRPYNFTGNNEQIINEIPLILKNYLNYINKINKKFIYNSVLINWYEGEDYIGSHSDNEKNLKSGSDIYSLSFGEKRIMTFENKNNKLTYNYELENNSILIMKNGCQENFKHGILKQKNKNFKNKRINVTFRCVI